MLRKKLGRAILNVHAALDAVLRRRALVCDQHAGRMSQRLIRARVHPLASGSKCGEQHGNSAFASLGVAADGMGASLLVVAGDANILLIGRASEIDAAVVMRDQTTRHIPEFTGTRTSVFTTAPYSVDGGMDFVRLVSAAPATPSLSRGRLQIRLAS